MTSSPSSAAAVKMVLIPFVICQLLSSVTIVSVVGLARIPSLPLRVRVAPTVITEIEAALNSRDEADAEAEVTENIRNFNGNNTGTGTVFRTGTGDSGSEGEDEDSTDLMESTTTFEGEAETMSAISTSTWSTRSTSTTTTSPLPSSTTAPAPGIDQGEGTGSKDKKATGKTKDSELLEWEAPLYFQKNVPYYHSGFDDEDQPVWVMEIGKLPLRELGELDEAGSKLFDKYLSQLAVRIIKSIEAQNTAENEVTQGFAIMDADGLDFYSVANPSSILMIVRIFTAFRSIITEYLGACIIINANYALEVALNIARPLLGRAFEKIEVYGNNPTKWKNVLRHKIPKNSIPSWYGGAEDFKPIVVYG